MQMPTSGDTPRPSANTMRRRSRTLATVAGTNGRLIVAGRDADAGWKPCDDGDEVTIDARD